MSCWVALKLGTENKSQQDMPRDSREKKDDTESLPTRPVGGTNTGWQQYGIPIAIGTELPGGSGWGSFFSPAMATSSRTHQFCGQSALPIFSPRILDAFLSRPSSLKVLAVLFFPTSLVFLDFRLWFSFLGWKGLWTVLQPTVSWTGKYIWVHHFPAHWRELCL